MKLSRQNKIIIVIMTLVLTLVVGYALFSESINVKGTALTASNNLNGMITDGRYNDHKFRIGTKYIKLIVLNNYSKTNDPIINTITYYKNFVFKEVGE